MGSQVDETLPADNVKTSKAAFRAQFLTIKEEISALQTRTGVPGQDVFNDRPERWEVQALIAAAEQRASARERLPGLLAFGIVSFTVSNN